MSEPRYTVGEWGIRDGGDGILIDWQQACDRFNAQDAALRESQAELDKVQVNANWLSLERTDYMEQLAESQAEVQRLRAVLTLYCDLHAQAEHVPGQVCLPHVPYYDALTQARAALADQHEAQAGEGQR